MIPNLQASLENRCSKGEGYPSIAASKLGTRWWSDCDNAASEADAVPLHRRWGREHHDSKVPRGGNGPADIEKVNCMVTMTMHDATPSLPAVPRAHHRLSRIPRLPWPGCSTSHGPTTAASVGGKTNF